MIGSQSLVLGPLWTGNQYSQVETTRPSLLTLPWISSLTVGSTLFFLFTSSSSTRGLMVIPCSQKETEKNRFAPDGGEQRCSCSHLDEDGEQDENDGGCDKESFLWEVIDQEH